MVEDSDSPEEEEAGEKKENAPVYPPPPPPGNDPLAQTFFVDDETGVFITKVDVFF